MALKTFGTAATTSLAAMAWNQMSAIADMAAIEANIKNQSNPAHPIVPGGFEQGRLYLPGNRGIILLVPGDWVAYDNFGWPVVVSKESIAGGSSWVHS
jgi:hypothetical protein